MTHDTPEPKWPWRDFLKPDEASFINEAEAKRSDAAHAAAMRARIINRAIQRAKYAASKG